MEEIRSGWIDRRHVGSSGELGMLERLVGGDGRPCAA
jgi:hypothetical protein